MKSKRAQIGPPPSATPGVEHIARPAPYSQRGDAMTHREIDENEGWQTVGSRPSARADLRDALDDAVRRAYCEPLIPPVEGEDADLVRALAGAALLSDPNRMRHLAGIQAAAWAAVGERVDG